MALWAAIFPLDVAKTRIQVATPGSAARDIPFAPFVRHWPNLDAAL